MDFYNLRNYRYNSSDEFSYSITDLFFYYNLINFQNSSGGRSLTPLFENFVRTGEESAVNKYMKFYKIDVDKKKIVLNEAIKNLGVFNVSIKLFEGIVGNLKVSVVE